MIERQEQKIYGKDLVFHGYLIVQEGAQLRPDELRGIMIRIKNVAIGYYDPSMLDYRFNEGPRSRWLTGEIFVEEGLENALNIDRDSFNRFHPEFRSIQEYVHDLLRNKVFPQVYRQIEVRSTEKTRSKEEARIKHLKEVISSTIESPIIIRHEKFEAEENQSPQAVVLDKGAKVEVSIPEPETLKTKKSLRLLASSILALYEVALREKNREKQREVFTNLLLRFLQGW